MLPPPGGNAESRPEISLVIPVYNEEENLPVLAAEIREALGPLGRPYEVVFVDDGSTDGSPEVLRRLAREDRRVRIVRQGRNAGQSAALDAGFRFARGDVVVTLDADLQNDPADIPRLLEKLDGFDVVAGVRARRQDDWVRRASSRIANRVRNRVTHESITDVGCTLKAFRAEYLRRIPMFTGMHRFLPTLLKMEGARVVEIPVNHRPRLHGQPKYGIGNRLWRALADLFAVRWMQKRWIDRRISEEIETWNTTPSGSSSDSLARPSSSPASSSSGSPPSGPGRASFPGPSGT
jgi:glycosyltransferase involved in cell wall biosynthesis